MTKPGESAPSIDLRSLSYAFPDGSQGLQDISLSLPAGSRILLIGGLFFPFTSSPFPYLIRHIHNTTFYDISLPRLTPPAPPISNCKPPRLHPSSSVERTFPSQSPPHILTSSLFFPQRTAPAKRPSSASCPANASLPLPPSPSPPSTRSRKTSKGSPTLGSNGS